MTSMTATAASRLTYVITISNIFITGDWLSLVLVVDDANGIVVVVVDTVAASRLAYMYRSLSLGKLLPRDLMSDREVSPPILSRSSSMSRSSGDLY